MYVVCSLPFHSIIAQVRNPIILRFAVIHTHAYTTHHTPHILIHTHPHTPTHIHTSTQLGCVCMYEYVYFNVCVCVCVCVVLEMAVCMCVCVFAAPTLVLSSKRCPTFTYELNVNTAALCVSFYCSILPRNIVLQSTSS